MVRMDSRAQAVTLNLEDTLLTVEIEIKAQGLSLKPHVLLHI